LGGGNTRSSSGSPEGLVACLFVGTMTAGIRALLRVHPWLEDAPGKDAPPGPAAAGSPHGDGLRPDYDRQKQVKDPEVRGEGKSQTNSRSFSKKPVLVSSFFSPENSLRSSFCFFVTFSGMWTTTLTSWSPLRSEFRPGIPCPLSRKTV